MRYPLAFAFIVLFLLISCSKSSFSSKLRDYELPFAYEGQYDLVEFSDNPLFFVGKNHLTGNFIKIKIFSYSSKSDYIKDLQRHLTRTLYNYQFSSVAYPGQITRFLSCGTKKMPTINYSGNFSYIKLFARDSLGLSICDTDDYTHISYINFFVEEEKNRIIEVDFRQSKKDQSDQFLIFLKTNFSKLKPIPLKPFEDLFKFNQ